MSNMKINETPCFRVLPRNKPLGLYLYFTYGVVPHIKALDNSSQNIPLLFRYDVIMTYHDVKTDFFGENFFSSILIRLQNTSSLSIGGPLKFKFETQGHQAEGQGQGHIKHENQRNP